MVYTMSHIIYEVTNSKNIGIVLWVHVVFKPIACKTKGLYCRSIYFNWMEKKVHLRAFQQSEIQ